MRVLEVRELPMDSICVDKDIYPRLEVSTALVERYVECMNEGAGFPPILVEKTGTRKYRVIDGVHRLEAAKKLERGGIVAEVVDLNGKDPLLYAALKNRHGRSLTDEDAKTVARKAYERNPDLSTREIALAVGRSERAVRGYIRDLKARYELQRDLMIFKLYLLGWTQEQIGKAVGLTQQTISQKIPTKNGKTADFCRYQFPELVSETAASIVSDYKKGFPVSEIAEKNKWPEPLVWAVVLQGKNDLEKFKKLKWPLRTWDMWNFNDCDKRFGDEWNGQIPAQLVAHTLYFFTGRGDFVFDPVAGGGVVPDVCLVFERRCCAVDKATRRERPEIMRHYWDCRQLTWPEGVKAKPDLIFWDPPYYKKMASEYGPDSISTLSRDEYLDFFRAAFSLFHEKSAQNCRLAFLIADWRAFESTPAREENAGEAVLLYHYWKLLEETGWAVTHRIECPLSTQRMNGGIVSAMQEKRILGVVTRTLLIAKKVV